MVSKEKINKTDEKKRDKFFKLALFGVIFIILVFAVIQNQSKHNEVENLAQNISEGDIVMYYFYLETCPHCKDQERYHSVLLAKYPNLKILEYELSSKASQDKYVEIVSKTPNFEEDRISRPATPTTVIGEEYNIGYLSDAVTGKKLESMIEAEIAKKEAQN